MQIQNAMKYSKLIQSVTLLSLFFALLIVVLSGTITTVEAQDSDEVYSVVEEMPEIEGGLSALYEKIKYPKEAVRKEISGRVYLQVIVHEDGTAKNPEIIRDIGGGCGEAAAEAITKVKFKPGKKDGKKVKVKYSLPVTFRIEDR